NKIRKYITPQEAAELLEVDGIAWPEGLAGPHPFGPALGSEHAGRKQKSRRPPPRKKQRDDWLFQGAPPPADGPYHSLWKKGLVLGGMVLVDCSADPTALCALERLDPEMVLDGPAPLYKMHLLKRSPLNTPYPDIVDDVARLASKPKL